MHYITNAKNQIIAADEEFLKLLSIDDLTDIYQHIANDELTLEFGKDDTLSIKTSLMQEEYSINKIQLHSLVGEMYLIELKEMKSLDIDVDDTTSEEENQSEDKEEQIIPEALVDLALEDETSESEEPRDEDSVETEETSNDTEAEIEISDDILALVDDSSESETEEKEEDTSAEEDNAPESLDISDDELFDLLAESEDKDELMSDIKDDIILEDDNELFDLLPKDEEKTEDISVEDTQEGTKEETEVETQTESKEDEKLEPIVLDSEKLSSTIGISKEDYKTFVDEYIETAISLEKDFVSSDISKRKDAIISLTHLSSVLYIPVVGDILQKLENASGEELKSLLKELYSAISRLTVDGDIKPELVQPILERIDNLDISDIESQEAPQELEIEDSLDVSDIMQEDDTATTAEPQLQEEINVVQESTQEVSHTGGHKIDLSDVKPIHFDFSMDEAADELSLPVDLIEEFVNDFIEQAHEETEKMLTAYDNGDLDKVNKIGHLLKGTSSNLRIVPLADTLYKIQFCESLDELEPLIKDYWGHFLAFENQIKLRIK